MNLYRDRKNVSVEVVDGGWVLDWSDPSRDDEHDDLYRQSGMWPKKRIATSGREIFTDKKKLIKRLQEFL